MSTADGWLRRRLGVRWATSLASTAVVVVALLIGGLLLVVLLRHELSQGVRTAAEQRAQDLAGAVADDGPTRVSLFSQGGERSVAQVLRGDEVALSSPEIAGESPLSALRPAPGVLLSRRTGRLPVDDDQDHQVVAVGVTAPDGTSYVVLVTQSLGEVGAAVAALTALLAVGIPLIGLLVGAASFVLTGRALRPVEQMRRQMAGIGAEDLGGRVPVPAAHDEVRRLALTMNDMLGRLESATLAQRRFVSDASHELRSPLANVRATVEVAQGDPRGPQWEAVGAVVLQETGRLEALVADLLLLARVDERGLELRRTDVDLDDLLRTEADLIRTRGGVVLSVHLRPVKVPGDAARLSRVLRNLLDNAARHAHSTVRLELRREEALAVVEISDDGEGVPAAERERAFERFVRLDSSRHRAGGGAGLGLAIVRQLVHAHGGTVSFVDPVLACGATVRVMLPAQPTGSGSQDAFSGVGTPSAS